MHDSFLAGDLISEQIQHVIATLQTSTAALLIWLADDQG